MGLKLNTQRITGRVGPHGRLTQIWKLVSASLVADALIVFFAQGTVSEDQAQRVAIASALFVLFFLDQHKVSTIMSRLRNFHQQRDKKARASHVPFIATLVAVLAAKFLLLPSITNIVGIIFTVVVAFGVVVSIKRALSDRRLHAEALSKSPWIQITLWEKQLVLISILPLFAARIISLFGTLTIENSRVTPLSIGCFVLSALLLLCLKPDRGAFIGLCQECKTPVPIAFVQYGKCPSCDRELAARLETGLAPATEDTPNKQN